MPSANVLPSNVTSDWIPELIEFVRQQSQKIRDLARDPNNRQEVVKRLEKLDEGVQHHDDEPCEGDPPAPLPKLKAKLSLPAPPSKDANQ